MPKGFKQCHACQEMIAGPRTKVCPNCKADLKKEDAPNVDPVTGEATKTVYSLPDTLQVPEGNILVIHTPAGACPVTLRGEDGELPTEDIIQDWAFVVRQKMLDKMMYLTNGALAYWANAQLNPNLRYAPNGVELSEVKRIIKALPDITWKEVPA